jgi:anti-sigma regulatory factor (Ser/Thr protein kinase)
VVSTLSVVLLNHRRELGRLSGLVDEFAAANSLSPDDAALVHLLLDETVVNVMKHGFDDDREHEIRVGIALDRNVLTVQIEDDGRAFNPLEHPPPDLTLPLEERPIGGLGIHIVRMSVDEMVYRRDRGRNVLTMRKTLGS